MNDATDDERRGRFARSFGPVADAYERGRPVYPAEAARWLVGRDAAIVLELGAGTGKLTRTLAGLGHDVHATDPDEAMLEVLREHVPGVRSSVSSAEEIPAPDRSVDVVVAGQAFHWFDQAKALPEIARVLKPGGHFSLAWNFRDERIPWVRRLGVLIGNEAHDFDPMEVLATSGVFGFVEDATFSFWQDINRDILVDLVASRSNVATLEPNAREAKLAEVAEFYDGFGRGYDGMQLPYLTHCYRTTVLGGHRGGDNPDPESGPGDDPDMLLIDFR